MNAQPLWVEKNGLFMSSSSSFDAWDLDPAEGDTEWESFAFGGCEISGEGDMNLDRRRLPYYLDRLQIGVMNRLDMVRNVADVLDCAENENFYAGEYSKPEAVLDALITDSPMIYYVHRPHDVRTCGCIDTSPSYRNDVAGVIVGATRDKGRSIFIDCLAVSPDLQGKGIGSFMIECMKERFDEIRLMSMPANFPFYEKCGLTQVPRSGEERMYGVPACAAIFVWRKDNG